MSLTHVEDCVCDDCMVADSQRRRASDLHVRIAELEAENARLLDSHNRTLLFDAKALGMLERERDEALALHEFGLKQDEEVHREWSRELLEARAKAEHFEHRHTIVCLQHDVLVRQLSEARAACAAVTKASNDFIRILGDIHHGPKPSQERFNEVADAFNKTFEQGSTAGSDLLARLEKAEADLAEHREARKWESVALKERVERETRLTTQLEAMRAALERAKGRVFEGALILRESDDLSEGDDADDSHVQLMHAMDVLEKALSSSAPRAYRNAVLEEAANWFENEDQPTHYTLEQVTERVRALKDGGT